MAEDTASALKPQRRRASRAAGPANSSTAEVDNGAGIEAPAVVKVRMPRSAAPPPRRQPHRMLVAAVSLGVLVLATAAVGAVVLVMSVQQHNANAAEARQQRFVDTATQTVVNMFSYNQNNIDESVNRFVDGTSGPLRDMLSINNNVDNLKAIFRDTNASSEAVVNGAALEKVDETAKNAAVLVSVRVTVTDIEGTNRPSQPYRLRIIVHEDDNGHMTSYDLKYPEGGN
jgi:Mce-associated membrane protein